MAIMKKHQGFTPEKDRVYYRSHTVEIQGSERYPVRDERGQVWLVVGYGKTAMRTSGKRCPMGCEPSLLVVRKVLKNGAPGKLAMVWKFDDAPHQHRLDFLMLFPHLDSFKEHDKHLLALAKELVNEYGSNPPDAANYYINRNPYWSDLRNAAVWEREERLAQAKANRLEASAQMYADESFAGYFSGLQRQQPSTPPGELSARIEQAHKLADKYKVLRRQILEAHPHENMRFEVEEAHALKRQFNELFYELRPDLPKVLGNIPVLPPRGAQL